MSVEFYEDDESMTDVASTFERGEKLTTRPPLGPQIRLGNPRPDRDGVRPIAEPFCGWIKPMGGLWTSTQLSSDGYCGWIEWCNDEKFGPLQNRVWRLDVDPTAKVYTIDEHADLKRLAQLYPPVCDHKNRTRRPGSMGDGQSYGCPDAVRSIGSGVYWRGVAEDFDAVHLTDAGQWATRHTTPNLYGWDCESTLWFRWKFLDVVDLGRRRYRPRQHGAPSRGRAYRYLRRTPYMQKRYGSPAPIKPSVRVPNRRAMNWR